MVRLTRRELLAGFATVAVDACRRPTGRKISGAIVGANHRRGHRLRDLRPNAATDITESTRVAIIGAGVAGLSAAWALERAGVHDFVVLELEDEAGGTTRSGRGPVCPYPWGAHYIVAPPATNTSLVALLTEVGAVEGWDTRGRPLWAEGVVCREPRERVYFRGEWHEGLFPRIAASKTDLADLAAFEQAMRDWSLWHDDDGRPAFAAPRSSASSAPPVRALDEISMTDYLHQQSWRSPRLHALIDYSCRDDYGTTAGQTSAWAGIHYFASRLELDNEEPQEILTWPEGNDRVVRHLADVAGTRLRTRALVYDVAPTDGGAVVSWVDCTTDRVCGLAADRVIFALPRFLARHVIAPYRTQPPAHLGATTYGSWMVANLTLDDRPLSHGAPLAWDNVIYNSEALGYVVATHQLGQDYGPTVLTYYRPIIDERPERARQMLLQTSWQEWVDMILADLTPAHPGLLELIRQVDVYLWGHAMVRARPGFMWSPALAASAVPFGPIHFAHTDLSGMALFEEAHDHGVRAARAVQCELGLA